VLVHGGHQGGGPVGGSQAADADGGRQLVEGSVGGAQGSAGGSAAEQAIHEKKR
jgi:hypothetical protein